MDLQNLTNASKRRAIVYFTLKSFFPKEWCMQALWILEDKFPTSKPFSVLAFIDEIGTVINVGSSRANLSGALTKLLYSSSTTTYSDPWEEMQSFVRPSSLNENLTQQAELTDAMVVFNFMLNGLFLGIRNLEYNKEKSMCELLMRQIPTMGLGIENSTQLMAWCKNAPKQTIERIKPESAMTKVIHAIYLWSCEYLGPIQADKLFAYVVREAETLAEAKSFSPRSFFN